MLAAANIDINGVILGAIAFFNMITAYLAYRTHQSVTQTKVDVAKIEVATNSMKDQLVKATGEASHAAGVMQGLAQAAQSKAQFEAGAKSERQDKEN